MKQFSNNPIFNAGGPAPQLHMLEWAFLDEEKMLLFAAWAHGMQAYEVVHRYTLFGFIQTHLHRKSEEQLQRTLESSSNWEKQGRGDYVLRNRGAGLISRFWNATPVRSALNANYAFWRDFHDVKFAVELRPFTHEIVVSVDDIPSKGVEACRKLENLGGTFRTNSSSRTSRLWNWIVQDGDYRWKRCGGWTQAPGVHPV